MYFFIAPILPRHDDSFPLRQVPRITYRPTVFRGTPVLCADGPSPPKRPNPPTEVLLANAIRTSATTEIPRLLSIQLSEECVNRITPSLWKTAVGSLLSARNIPGATNALQSGLSSYLAPDLRIAHFVQPLRTIARAGRWRAVFTVLGDMARVGGGVCPDERLLVSLANIAIEKKAYTVCLRMFDFMKTNSISLGPVGYSVLLKSHGRARNVVAVKNVVAEMFDTKIEMDSILLNSAVDALVRCDDLNAASELLDDDAYVDLHDAASYNTMIKGFVGRGLVERAFGMVDTMRGQGCEPNSVTRNTLLSACVRVGDFSKAWSLVDSGNETGMTTPRNAEENGDVSQFRQTGTRDLSDSDQADHDKQRTIALTSLLCGLADVGRISEAQALLSDMSRRGAPPSAITYAAFLTSCFRQSAVEDAIYIFNAMPRDQPRTITVCNAYLAGLCKTDDVTHVDRAAAFVDEMLDSKGGVRPNVETFNLLMSGFVRHQDFDQAEFYLKRMSEARVRPNIVSYTVLMKGYGDTRQYTKAKMMFREISRRHIRPDGVALNAFVSICASSGDTRSAQRVLEYMEREGGGLSPTAYSYTPLMRAFSRMKKDEEVWATYKRMRGKGILVHDFEIDLLCDHVTSSLPTEENAIQSAQLLRDAQNDGISTHTLRKARRKLLAVFRETRLARHFRGLNTPDFLSPSEEIFQKHGWNEIDSGWRVI